MTVKDRILFVLNQKGIKNASEIAEPRDNIYHNLYKQIFSSNIKTVSVDVMTFILEKFPDVSADYIIRGEGTWERTRIVTPPQQRQDIHLADGARAAISQSGSARIEPDEPIGQESLTALIEEKDKIIASLQHDIAVLKEAIRVLSSK